MTVVPTRPPSHQIEDQSRRRFADALPESWVFRDKTSDYGIDGEVEIFDADGRATGLSFLVQLKATTTDEARITLKVDTVNYYRSFNSLVLLVLWVKSLNRLYARWASLVDLRRGQEQQQTVSITFTDADIWGQQTPAQLRSDVVNARFFEGSGLSLPLGVFIEIEASDNIGSIKGHEFRSQFRLLAQEHPHLFSVSESVERSAIIRRLDGDSCAVSVASKMGVVLHGLLSANKGAALARDIAATVAIPLGQLGRHDLAAKIILELGRGAAIAAMPQIAGPFIESLLRSYQFSAAVNFAIEVAQAAKSDGPAFLALNAALSMVNAMPAALLEEAERLCLHFIQAATTEGNSERAAVWHFNLGGLFRNRDLRSSALMHFRRAARLSQKYQKDPSITWRAASVLFTAGKFKTAARCYQRAVDLGAEAPVRALHADALLFAGQYEAALTALEDYCKMAGELESEWILKRMLLRNIVIGFQIKSQTRNPKEASRQANVENSIDPHTRRAQMSLALAADALSGLAWFNLGVALKDKGELDEAAVAFLTCALLRRGDLEAWRNAILLWISVPTLEVEIAGYIVDCAYFANGEKIISELRAYLGQMEDPDRSHETMVALDAIITALPKRTQTLEVRNRGLDDDQGSN